MSGKTEQRPVEPPQRERLKYDSHVRLLYLNNLISELWVLGDRVEKEDIFWYVYRERLYYLPHSIVRLMIGEDIGIYDRGRWPNPTMIAEDIFQVENA